MKYDFQVKLTYYDDKNQINGWRYFNYTRVTSFGQFLRKLWKDLYYITKKYKNDR